MSDADRRRISQLEKVEAALRNEMTKLKDIAEVASSQARALEAHQASRDKEVVSLRQQLLDFQAQSDEKTVIGIALLGALSLSIFIWSLIKWLAQSCNTDENTGEIVLLLPVWGNFSCFVPIQANCTGTSCSCR